MNEIKTNDDFLQFIFNLMMKLDKGEITTEEARSQAKLAKQANNSMRIKLDGKRLHKILKNEK